MMQNHNIISKVEHTSIMRSISLADYTSNSEKWNDEEIETLHVTTNPLQLMLFVTILMKFYHEGKVQRLYLQGNHLKELSESLIYLHQLRALNCDDNQLTVPALTQFFEAIHLYMQQKGLKYEFSGHSLPAKLYHYFFGVKTIQNLVELSLRNNQLPAVPASLCNIQTLVRLKLDGNQISQLPDELAQLDSLETLSVSSNSLSKLPSNVTSLTNLRELNVANNRLRELPAGISSLSSLTNLDCHRNFLANLPRDTHQLPNIRKIDASDNEIEYIDAELLSVCTSLAVLALESNCLDALPEITTENVHLREIYLAKNNLAALPPSFLRLRELTSLSLPTHEDFILNTGAGFLTLYEQALKVDDKLGYAPLDVSRIKPVLQRRWFSDENIAVANVVYSLKKRIHRAYLSLKLAKFERVLDAGTRHFWGAQSLNRAMAGLIERLVVADQASEVSEQGVIFAYCLHLCNQGLKRAANSAVMDRKLLFIPYQNYLKELADKKSLEEKNQYKDFSANDLAKVNRAIKDQYPKVKLTCSPSDFNDLFQFIHVVEYLDLSDNSFESVPECLFQLVRLVELRMSGAGLQKLPDGMLQLRNLKSLFLDHNQLLELPAQLFEQLPLAVLDVSDNRLVTIPRIPQAAKGLRIILAENPLEYLPNDIVTIQCLLFNLSRSKDGFYMQNIPWCIDALLIAYSKKTLSKLFPIPCIDEAMKTKKQILAIERILARLRGVKSIVSNAVDCKMPAIADPGSLADMVVDHFEFEPTKPDAEMCKQYSLTFFQRQTLYGKQERLEAVHKIFFEPREIKFKLIK